jgi:alkylated DNA repair dioxygenase AlkB
MNVRSSLKTPTMPLPRQADLFGAAEISLQGFRYRPDLIDAEDEAKLVERLGELPFQPFGFRGHLANRQVVGFGLRYDYGRREVIEAPPIPDWLTALQEMIGAFAGRPAEAFVQVLINEYQPGAGIGWHRDRPHFDEVVGVSLLAPCTLRFRRKTGETWDRQSMTVDPRSAYLLTGPSRTVWEHSIPPLGRHRYSITFRTLAQNA